MVRWRESSFACSYPGIPAAWLRGDTEKELCSPEHNGLTDVGSDRDAIGWTFLCKRARVRRVMRYLQRTRPTIRICSRDVVHAGAHQPPYHTGPFHARCVVRHNACHPPGRNGTHNRRGVGYTSVGQFTQIVPSRTLSSRAGGTRGSVPLHGHARTHALPRVPLQ